MTIAELIDLLKKIDNQDAIAFVWADSNRMPINSIDHWDKHFLDINAEKE